MTSIQEDQWLGAMLGRPAYRIVGQSSSLVAADLPQGEAFIDARVDVGDFQALSHLQGLGFAVIDCNVTLEWSFERPVEMESIKLETPPSLRNIRFADMGDEQGVRALAKEAFQYDRFHRDPRISDNVADIIKEEWAGNFFSGNRGTWMVISTDDEGVTGFVQLLCFEKDALVIDLVAVATRSRRKGLGYSMIDFALRNCVGKFPRIRVGTQLGNSPSLQFYEAMGFRLRNAAYVLHRHNKDI